jgi:hypothetical protein
LQRGGVEPNSLAAICEMVNGSWLQKSTDAGNRLEGDLDLEPLGSRLPGFFKSAGFARGLDKSGPAYPFLVGLRSSGGAAYKNEKELFRMVGQSMVAWATDSVMQDGLFAYVRGSEYKRDWICANFNWNKAVRRVFRQANCTRCCKLDWSIPHKQR